MLLHVDSDATYLVLPKSISRIDGCFQLSNHPTDNHDPLLNGVILVACKILQHIASSAAESETAGVFYNCQLAIPIQNILEALNHTQPETPVKTENSTKNGFVHNNIHQK